MKSSARKAVILNNLSSPYIYQAIVILNENGIENENTALIEAERIVSEYMKKRKKDENEDILLYSRPKSTKKKRSEFPFFVTLSIFSVFLFLVTIFLCR